jgi:hypothetical protein
MIARVSSIVKPRFRKVVPNCCAFDISSRTGIPVSSDATLTLSSAAAISFDLMPQSANIIAAASVVWVRSVPVNWDSSITWRETFDRSVSFMWWNCWPRRPTTAVVASREMVTLP